MNPLSRMTMHTSSRVPKRDARQKFLREFDKRSTGFQAQEVLILCGLTAVNTACRYQRNREDMKIKMM